MMAPLTPRLFVLPALAVVALLTALLAWPAPAPIAAQPVPVTPPATPDPALLPPRQCVPPLPLVDGQIVYVDVGVYIRSEPSISAPQLAYIVAADEGGTGRLDFRIRGASVCNDGFTWWPVARTGAPRIVGWVAQGIPDKSFLFPLPLTDPCFPPISVTAGQEVALFTGIRVREAPTLRGRVLTVAPLDARATILEGPSCNDGYNWWRVRVAVLGVAYEGWIVEGFPQQALLNTQPDVVGTPVPCGPVRPLAVTGQGVIRFERGPLKTLRAGPSLASEPLVQLPSGLVVDILSDAVCADGFNWRQVRVRGGTTTVEGWLAEGTWLGRFRNEIGQDYGPPR